MPATAATPATASIPQELLQRIAELSENDSDLQATERKRMEENLQYSRSERIWYKLSTEQRDSLRSAVVAMAPSGDLDRYPSLTEHRCIVHIRKVLADVDARSGNGEE